MLYVCCCAHVPERTDKLLVMCGYGHGCDRAWLLYPCDPEAHFWGVPMERTVPAWPGDFALGVQVPMDPPSAATMAEAIAAPHCLASDPTTERQVPEEVGQAFGVKAQLAVSIHPHTDKAWLLGLHHCTEEHVFTAQEQRLFDGIGERIAEALDAMLLLRDLRESERQITELQRMETIGDLAGGIAHDFNNQLLVILCYADMLRDQVLPSPRGSNTRDRVSGSMPEPPSTTERALLGLNEVELDAPVVRPA